RSSRRPSPGCSPAARRRTPWAAPAATTSSGTTRGTSSCRNTTGCSPAWPPEVRLCFVIQRYGLEVAGGSELHCRWLAGRLARRHQVEVATTCALDYLEWRDHYPAGPDTVEGIAVTRYPVARPRSERRFALVSDLVFHEEHSLADEREWVVENGPFSPQLVRSLPRRRDVDLFVFYSYRYYQTFFGLPPVASRAV